LDILRIIKNARFIDSKGADISGACDKLRNKFIGQKQGKKSTK
jgi:hypothetical protein